MRKEAPTEQGEYISQRIIGGKITQRRSILWYKLYLRKRKRYRRKKKCWACNSIDHLREDAQKLSRPKYQENNNIKKKWRD